ncbi:MAG TPA: hypothetical protein VFQ79_03350 [Bryobacteraceae bacterium]|nr:hypothetical protein [Bryobacteraceae bacterium]
MSTNLLDKRQVESSVEQAMPPPAVKTAGTDEPGSPLFRGLADLRAEYRSENRRERMLQIGGALIGTAILFAVLYVSMMWME